MTGSPWCELYYYVETASSPDGYAGHDLDKFRYLVSEYLQLTGHMKATRHCRRCTSRLSLDSPVLSTVLSKATDQ